MASPDRVGRLLAFGMLVLAVSLIGFPWLQTQMHVTMYGIALGISGGIVTVIFFSAYGQAFGRTHLGAIQAVVQVVTVLASAVGPMLLTRCRISASTPMFFYTSAVAAVVPAVLATLLRLPSQATRPALCSGGVR